MTNKQKKLLYLLLTAEDLGGGLVRLRYRHHVKHVWDTENGYVNFNPEQPPQVYNNYYEAMADHLKTMG